MSFYVNLFKLYASSTDCQCRLRFQPVSTTEWLGLGIHPQFRKMHHVIMLL